MLKKAQNKNDSVKIINDCILKLDNATKYDAVVVRDVLHHIEDQSFLLLKIRNLLVDEGVLIIQDFNPNYYKSKVIFAFERLLLEKIRPISNISLVNILSELNYCVVEKEINKRDYLVVARVRGSENNE